MKVLLKTKDHTQVLLMGVGSPLSTSWSHWEVYFITTLCKNPLSQPGKPWIVYVWVPPVDNSSNKWVQLHQLKQKHSQHLQLRKPPWHNHADHAIPCGSSFLTDKSRKDRATPTVGGLGRKSVSAPPPPLPWHPSGTQITAGLSVGPFSPRLFAIKQKGLLFCFVLTIAKCFSSLPPPRQSAAMPSPSSLSVSAEHYDPPAKPVILSIVPVGLWAGL